MSQIKIEVTGVSYAEAQELARLLEQVEGVESTRVPWQTRDHAFDPNSISRVIPQIKASVEVHAVILVIAASVASKFFEGAASEPGKDAYGAVKNLVLRKFGEWRASKAPEQRERIVLVFDDEHMLVVKGEERESGNAASGTVRGTLQREDT